MASSSASSSAATTAAPRQAGAAKDDPILRNALRYTMSAREYAALHKYILSRSRVLKKRAPSVETVNRIMNGDRPASRRGSLQDKGKGKTKKDADAGKAADGATAAAPAAATGRAGLVGADDFNARAVRHSIRVFLATGIGLKLWSAVMRRLMGNKQEPGPAKKPTPFHKSPTFRLSLSLSTILLLYRLLFRFFTRLRGQLLEPSALPFRQRNPRTAGTLTSPYAPAVGASLAGLALGIYPAQQLRVSVAIFALFRALEFGWNVAEDGGSIWGLDRSGRPRARPWWWGSWMLQPFAFGQLLHAAVFDRDCFPLPYGDFIFNRSPAYLHSRPAGVASWPGKYEVVDALAAMAKNNWPPFSSLALFAPKPTEAAPALQQALTAIQPLTSTAHPLLTSLSCATLHPSDPSCARTFLTFWLRSFPPTARFFVLVSSALALPRLVLGGGLYHAPVAALRRVLASALRMTAFVTGALSTAWGSICFFQAWFPRRFLATHRFFLGGFLAGFWAWIERRGGRSVFLYSARTSVDSLWKVGVKRRWWRAVRGGDVWVFVLAVMLSGVVYERDARAVREGSWRRGISWVRGEGWVDWSVEEEEEEDEEEEQEGVAAAKKGE